MKKLWLNGTIGLLFIGLVGTQAVSGRGKGTFLSPTLAVNSFVRDSIPWAKNKARKSLKQREKQGTLNADTTRPKKDTATWNNQQKDWQQKSDENGQHKKSETSRDSVRDGRKSF